jgi:K(+)-stimulated pyrophosphate-energized sodium pump
VTNRNATGARLIRASRYVGLVALAVGAGVLMLLWQNHAAAQAEGETAKAAGLDPYMVLSFWGVAFVGSIAALIQAFVFYGQMKASDEGTPRMIEIAGYVREGAAAYLRQQYIVVAIFFLVIGMLLAIAAFVLDVQSKFVPFAFLTGGLFSGLAGFFGMKTATLASSRTAAGAQKSLNQGLIVAFRSGAVMGLTVVGLGLLDICLWFAILYWGWPAMGFEAISMEEITVTMLCFGMGASSQALFARVGGGIFTKAADVGADLVGKVEQGIPEDDPRNPATIADNVGDNVGDVAGMGADLYESYCGAILATAALGVAMFSGTGLAPEHLELEFQLRAMFLPLAISGVGIFLSILGIYLVRTSEDASQKNLLAALARGINFATLLVIVASIGLSWWILPKKQEGFDGLYNIFGVPGVSFSIIVGLMAGWLIGKWTEYCTANEFKPTQELAEQALTGPATIIIGGIAEGMKSTWFPVIVVCAGTLLSFGFANGWQFEDLKLFGVGLYGVGIAAVGMLSTLGITLATDAYGPIADNAGGNAQMAGLDPVVRERTDALDSLGNTTAATGKGFAIGSAALTALALLAAYIEEVRIGIDRWGDAVVAADAEPGFYKVSPKLIVQVRDVEQEKLRRKKWLVMPHVLRDPDAAREWKDVNTQSGPAKIPADVLDETDGVHSGSLATIKGGLVGLKEATLPDFTNYYDATLMNPKVLVGMLIGTMSTFLFCALTMKAVGRAAKGMVEEVRRQFHADPGIMAGTSKPDYATPVAISTKAAQREMIVPSLLGLATPVVTGLVLGVGGVMGLLVGALCSGFCVAVFMANAGGAWDNAKKYIEGGAHGGKYLKNKEGKYVDKEGKLVEHAEDAKNPAHGAAVIGDTVGDPFKDTSGPSLNILIKLMSMVSVVVAGLVVRYSLAALGWF